MSYKRPVSTVHDIPSIKKKSTLVSSDMVLLRTKILFVTGCLHSFLQRKIYGPLQIRCRPAPFDLNLRCTSLIFLQLCTVTLTHSDSSQAKFHISRLTTTVCVVMSSHRIPAWPKPCAAFRNVVSFLRLIVVNSSTDHQARIQPLVFLPATAYQTYWQLPSISLQKPSAPSATYDGDVPWWQGKTGDV